jgi:hypothetical protein
VVFGELFALAKLILAILFCAGTSTVQESYCIGDDAAELFLEF